MKKSFTPVGLLILGGFFVLAATDWPPFSELLRRMDFSGDQRISHTEWKGDEGRFRICDEDNNGLLTQYEYERTAQDYQNAYEQGFDEYEMYFLRPMDRDGDNKISAAEFTSYAHPYGGEPVSFAALDTNADGFITDAEYAPWFANETLLAMRGLTQLPADPGTYPPFEILLKLMDRNSDRRINEREWKGAAELFRIYDKDRNGIIIRDEYDRAMKDYQSAYDQGFDDFEMHFLRPMDRDGDKKVSAAEFTSYAHPYGGTPVTFATLDKNGDGYITDEEFARWFGYETLKAMRGIH